MWRLIFVLFCTSHVTAQFNLNPAKDDNDDDLKLGGECEYHDDCESIPNAICGNTNICECADEYLTSSNNSTCLPMATKAGDKCEIQEQCSNIKSAKCVGSICAVTQVAVPPMIKAESGGCSNNSQCALHQICQNGTCVGKPLFSITIPPTILKVATLSMACFNDSDCNLDGSACIDKLCQCQKDFVNSLDMKSCLPKAKFIGDKCTETTQCISLNGSICENEKCSQKIAKFLDSIGEKLPLLMIGSTCQKDDECKHISNAICQENVCQCSEKYITSVSSNSCLLKAVKEGDSCEIDKQCENIKGAVCNKNKCVKPAVMGTKMGSSASRTTLTGLGLIVSVLNLIFV